MRKLFFVLLPLSVILVTWTACQEEDLSETEPQRLQDADWRVRYNDSGNYLEFKTEEDFEATYALLDTIAPSEASNWGQRYGLVSLMSIFSDVQKAQSQYLEDIDVAVESGQLTKEEALAKGQFSPYLLGNEKILLIAEDGRYRPNIFHDGIGYVTNEDGIVKVEGALKKYDFFIIKTLENGSSEDVKALLNNSSMEGLKVEELKHSFYNPESGQFVEASASDIKSSRQASWWLAFTETCENTQDNGPFVRDRKTIGTVRLSENSTTSFVTLETEGFIKGTFGWSSRIADNDFMQINRPDMRFRVLGETTIKTKAGGVYVGQNGNEYLRWTFYNGPRMNIDRIDVGLGFGSVDGAYCEVNHD